MFATGGAGRTVSVMYRLALLAVAVIASSCSSLLTPTPTYVPRPSPATTVSTTTTTTEPETVVDDSVLFRDRHIAHADTAEPFWCGADKAVTLSVIYQKGTRQRTETVVYNLANAVGSGWIDEDLATGLKLPHPVGYVLRPDGFVQCFWQNPS